MLGQSKVYAAIRQGERGPWIDASTIHLLSEVTRTIQEGYDKRDPQWAALHPLIRIAELHLCESLPVQQSPASPVPVKTRTKKSADPIMIDGLDCTDVIREMEKNQTALATPNDWLPNPAYARKDKRMGEMIRAAITSVESYGEDAVIPCEDKTTITVRRRK